MQRALSHAADLFAASLVDIPNYAHWSLQKISDICSLVSRGYAPVYIESSGVKAIGQRCVTQTSFDPSVARPHSENAMRRVLLAEKGDVLLNSTGTGTIGRSCVFFEQERFVVDGHVTVLRPLRGYADSRWLNVLIRSGWFQAHMERFCYRGSTNQLELSCSQLALSTVPTPSLSEQRVIGDILDTLDTQIQKTEAIVAKLQQVKQGLLHDLLIRGVDANGQLRPTREQAPELYKESPLGWIPAEWSYAKLDQLCSHIVDCPHSTPVYQDEGILVARTMHIKNGVFLEDQASKVSDIEYQRRIARLEPKPGDIIFTREAPVGEAFLVPSQMKICLGQRVMVIRPKIGELDGEFLLHHIYSGQIQRKMQLLTAGTTNPHLNVADVRQMLVPLPDLQEQKSIGFTLKNYQQRELYEREKVIKLSRQKAGLMDDLLTGRVRVNHLTS